MCPSSGKVARKPNGRPEFPVVVEEGNFHAPGAFYVATVGRTALLQPGVAGCLREPVYVLRAAGNRPAHQSGN